MADPAGKYITAADLINRLTPQVYLAMFDDDNTGDLSLVNTDAVQLVIDEAEGEVDSYLITENPMPLASLAGGKIDRLVKTGVLDFAQSLSFRHPEYVKRYGEDPRADGLWGRATDRMKRIRSAIQQLPDIKQQTGQPPANVGGIVTDDGPRTIITSADGTNNSGDF